MNPSAVLVCCAFCLGLSFTGAAAAADAAALRVAAPGPDCKPDPQRHLYCSLREAIATANAAAGPQRIELAAEAVYELTDVDHDKEGGNGLPAIVGTLQIAGNGATIRRSAAADVPLFRLLRVADSGRLALDHLILRNGATGRGFDGAAIWNTGHLTLSHCTLESNHSGDDGGAVRNDGKLAISDSAIRGNSARWRGGVGGGLQSSTQFGGAETTLERTVLENNEAWAGGGAMWLMGTTVVVDTRLSGNRAGERGGGIMNYGNLELRNATVTDNQAGVTGGGLFTYGTATLSHTRLSGNRAMIASDCQGTLVSRGDNRIGNSYRCTLQDVPGDASGAAPLVGRPADGATQPAAAPAEGAAVGAPASAGIAAADAGESPRSPSPQPRAVR